MAGTGTHGLTLASAVQRVIGIEMNAAAVSGCVGGGAAGPAGPGCCHGVGAMGNGGSNAAVPCSGPGATSGGACSTGCAGRGT